MVTQVLVVALRLILVAVAMPQDLLVQVEMAVRALLFSNTQMLMFALLAQDLLELLLPQMAVPK
jgi:hypothetical protein